MGLIDQATSKLADADLVIMSIIETIRDQGQPATASAVASLIGGAPVRAIATRLRFLEHEGLIGSPGTERYHYALTPMGAELLARELIGWTPSPREQQLRDALLRSATAGAMRQN